jgi:hypothetical protein
MEGSMSVAEKIETIMDCFLRNRTATGTFGDIYEHRPGRYRLYVNGLGRHVSVWRCPLGWHVEIGLVEGIDAELLQAAQNVFGG